MYRKVVFYDFIQKIISTNGRTGNHKRKSEFPQQLWQNSPKMKMFQCQQFKVFAIFLTASPVLFCHMKKKLIKILLFSDFVKKWK